jgi:hypothetical protein
MASAPSWERSNNHGDTEDTEKTNVFLGRKTAIVSRPLFVVRSKVKIPFMQLTTDNGQHCDRARREWLQAYFLRVDPVVP